MAATASRADTLDLVRLDVDPAQPDRYFVDGKARALERIGQRFQESDGEDLLTEVWHATLFGPVLPGGYAHKIEPGVTYAVQWTGFQPEAVTGVISRFWDLLTAPDLDTAQSLLRGVGMPSYGMVLASSAGDIGFSLTGRLPQRRSAAPSDRPASGKSADARWLSVVPKEQMPAVKNPAAGAVVASNQRITEDGLLSRAVGTSASTPWRARRVWERVVALFEASQPPDPQAVLGIQQDPVSIEARSLAPLLAAACPESIIGVEREVLRGYCEALRTFDGVYAKKATGALPFDVTFDALLYETLSIHLGQDAARQLRTDPATRMAFAAAIETEARGETSALLDDRRTSVREGLAGMMQIAANTALATLAERGGESAASWRWGAHHQATFSSPMSAFTFLGLLFQTPKTEQSGCAACPRAETGPEGAAMRMLALLSTPPRAQMVLDLGQSGHFGHPNFQDHHAAWTKGETLRMRTSPNVEGFRYRLVPKATPALPKDRDAGPAAGGESR